MAFTATISGQKSSYNNEKIIFNQVLTNEGRAYDGSSGIFTCPSNGVYVFTWTNMAAHDDTSCKMHLSINGSTSKSQVAAYGDLQGVTSTAHSQSTMAVTVRLSRGDRVWVYSPSCDYLYSSPYTAFSGWKL